MDDLLADFMTECAESLSELDVAVVRLEQTPDDQPTLSLIFRQFHTIKGTSGFFGLPRLQSVAHAAETLLDKLRTHVLRADPHAISLILAAIDRIRVIVDAVGHTHEEPAGDDAPLITALVDLASCKPGEPTMAPGRIETPPAPADAFSRAPTIRLGVDVLENLMTLVSELVLTRNQLLQILRSSGETGFRAPMHRLSQLTSDLQEGVMKTRMQPIGTAWAMLPRLARDLSQALGKRIELAADGSDTELDRQVLELIKDPLIHMVRNSADHGIEPADERRALGKPEAGTITLSAHHEGGEIVIEISDDGRGLDAARIGARALSLGLVSEDALRRMREAEIHRFIFQPGFSTAVDVTSVSGRGVGMDVVKTNIERINGTIDLDSRLGHGTRFRIKIPLTLAIISALIIGTTGERFAIPQTSIVEIVLPGLQPRVTLESIGGTQVLRLRDRLLPVLSMRQLLELDGGKSPDERIVVVISIANQRIGLLVAEVFDTEEIVVKPVASMIRHIALFSGNAILGDGSVIMILDPLGIAREARLAAGHEAVAAEPDAAVARQQDRRDMLLIRAGAGALKALPLASIARLEMVPRAGVEITIAGPVTQYQGGLMPLIALDPDIACDTATQPLLVIDDEGRHVGLMVDEILDVVHVAPDVGIPGDRPGLVGTALIAGRATEIIDTRYWLRRASAPAAAYNDRPNSAKPDRPPVDRSTDRTVVRHPMLSGAAC